MKWLRTVLIIVCSVVVTALGIDASDTFSGSQGTLLSQVFQGVQGKCPEGMSEIDNHPTLQCVDTYEAAPGKTCPYSEPTQAVATQKNIEAQSCTAVSEKESLPWRFVSGDHALQLCARSGKRLPTSAEWYALTLGTSEAQSCNSDSGNVSVGGKYAECVSPHGAYDLIGNVWEWVSDDVIEGMYAGHSLPDSGYVTQVDASGVAVAVGENPSSLFGKDYFWSKKEGAYGMIRGGYYDSGADGGMYTVHAATLPTAASAGVGFRCVK